VTVRCRAVGNQRTEVTVTYELTALSAAGNDTLDALSPAAYADMLREWQVSIACRLADEGDP
jgi:hypothetical protein